MNEISAISPNTIVAFLKGVPLESTYENTAYWSGTKAEQTEEFLKYVKPPTADTDGTVYQFKINNLSYQRYGRNQIRVQIPMDLLLDCNYMMFNNARYGSKWFYAFITHLEYVNEVTTTVSYEIDVLQTWFFDYVPNACFVERAHSATDGIADNLLEESFDLGKYELNLPVYTRPNTVEELDTKAVYICAPWDATKSGDTWTITARDTGGTYSGVYSGVRLNRFDDINDANAAIQAATESLGDQSQAIVAMYIAPYNAYHTLYDSVAECWYLHNEGNDTSGYGGYTPHNNKLFTYPYRGLMVKNANGDSHIYRYEYFADAKNPNYGLLFPCQFEALPDPTPNGTVYLAPINYNNGWGYNTVTFNWYESMTSGAYPQLAYTTDSYKSYLAQSGSVQAFDKFASVFSGESSGAVGSSAGAIDVVGKALGSVLGGVVTAVTGGNVLGAATNIVSDVAGAMGQNIKAQNMPNSTQGTFGSKQLLWENNVGLFEFIRFRITKEYAMKIDAFWDWYGYPRRDVMNPPRHTRKHWTFCQTKNCTISGSIPADDERKICELYNSGIRWWSNIHNIGNYLALAEDNTPLS